MVAPISVTMPSSTAGSSTSCCAFDQRCTSSTNSTVRNIPPLAPCITLRASATPEETAESWIRSAPDGVGEQMRQGGLARARRPPQDDRGEVAAGEQSRRARCPRPPGGPALRTPRTSEGACARRAVDRSRAFGIPTRSLRPTEDVVGPDHQQEAHLTLDRGPRLPVVGEGEFLHVLGGALRGDVDDGADDGDRRMRDAPCRGSPPTRADRAARSRPSRGRRRC